MADPKLPGDAVVATISGIILAVSLIAGKTMNLWRGAPEFVVDRGESPGMFWFALSLIAFIFVLSAASSLYLWLF